MLIYDAVIDNPTLEIIGYLQVGRCRLVKFLPLAIYS